jgi:hypothetical protein
VLKDEIEAYAYYNLAGITDEVGRKNLAILEEKMSPDVNDFPRPGRGLCASANIRGPNRSNE